MFKIPPEFITVCKHGRFTERHCEECQAEAHELDDLRGKFRVLFRRMNEAPVVQIFNLVETGLRMLRKRR